MSIDCAAFLSESCFFTSLTCCLLLVWTYSKTTNHFSCPHSSMICRIGVENKAPNAEVTSLNTLQVSDSTSKKDINKHMRHIAGNLMSSKKLEGFPTPKAIHNSLMSRCVIARTTTSTVRIDTLLCHWWTASSKCRSMQVSAFLCVHGARLRPSCRAHQHGEW